MLPFDNVDSQLCAILKLLARRPREKGAKLTRKIAERRHPPTDPPDQQVRKLRYPHEHAMKPPQRPFRPT